MKPIDIAYKFWDTPVSINETPKLRIKTMNNSDDWFPDLDIEDICVLFNQARKTYFPALEFIADQFSK